jgi:hypothetical protein
MWVSRVYLQQTEKRLAGVVLCDDAELGRVGLNDLELDRPHPITDQERVTLADGPVR